MFGLSNVVKRIERMKSLDAVGKPVAKWASQLTSPDGIKNALSGSWLGHQLHPMATDLPIGAWTMASALDLTGGETTRDAAQRLVGIGVLTSAPAALSGASDWSETYGKDQRVGLIHAVGNAAATSLQVTSWMVRRNGRHKLGAGLSLLGLASTLSSAYLGGHLSFSKGVGVNHTAFQSRSTQWIDVAAEAEVEEGQLMRVMAKNTPVMLTRHSGELRALSATCSHAGGPLNKGHIENDCVVCPWHQSKFRLTDGTPVRGPAGSAQPVWDVRAVDGRVSVKSAG